MSITKEHAKAAIRRFFCPINLQYPALNQMCFVETFEGKEGKEVAELYGFTRSSIQMWIDLQKNQGKVNNPATLLDFKEVAPSLIPGIKLFALVLAIVEASGNLSAVIEADEGFQNFITTQDYQIALNQGKTLLNFLVHAEGAVLEEKIRSLGIRNLSGSMAQTRLLEHTLNFKLSDFADYNEMGEELPEDVTPPVEAKVDILIPPGAPSQAVIHFGAMPDDAFDPFALPIGQQNVALYEDEQLAQALAASMQQVNFHQGGNDVERAIAASLQEPHPQDEELEIALVASLQEPHLQDEELEMALVASLQVEARPQDEDDDLRRAIAESKEAQKREEKRRGDAPVPQPPILPAARNAGVHVSPPVVVAPVPAPAPVAPTPPPPSAGDLFTPFRL